MAAPSIARPYLPSRPVPVVEPEHSRQPRISVWIDRNPGRAFLALTAFYAAVVFVLSSVKLLWLDELITLHIAQLGSPSAIWKALSRGADPNPPLTHLLVLGSMRLFGVHEFALRLPAMIGYWIGMLALFQFLQRWVSGTWALAGVVLSMSMAAFQYSYESRSYGIFYGLAMLAMYCWGRAVDPTTSSTRRWLALAGMVAALATGISTSYIAVLAFLPIAAGEATITWERWRQVGWREDSFLRSFKLRIWAGLAIAAAPLLLYRPLIQHAIAEFAPHAWNKVSLRPGQRFLHGNGRVHPVSRSSRCCCSRLSFLCCRDFVRTAAPRSVPDGLEIWPRSRRPSIGVAFRFTKPWLCLR